MKMKPMPVRSIVKVIDFVGTALVEQSGEA
jgi:hypothetical protein